MDKLTERELMNDILNELTDDYFHMVFVAAQSLYNIMKQNTKTA